LLEAALDLFARHGIAATSLNAIAVRARVTPAMLHYHFGGREALLDALVAERLTPVMAAPIGQIAAAAGDARALVHGLIEAVYGAVEANPWLPPLWVREVLSDGGHLRERLLNGPISAVAPRLCDAITREQKRGAINTDLDPRLTVVSLIGLTLFPFAAQSIWRRVFKAGDVTHQTMLRHTLALLDHGLELKR
jgi:AcrR family transcriptional regulator